MKIEVVSTTPGSVMIIYSAYKTVPVDCFLQAEREHDQALYDTASGPPFDPLEWTESSCIGSIDADSALMTLSHNPVRRHTGTLSN